MEHTQKHMGHTLNKKEHTKEHKGTTQYQKKQKKLTQQHNWHTQE